MINFSKLRRADGQTPVRAPALLVGCLERHARSERIAAELLYTCPHTRTGCRIHRVTAGRALVRVGTQPADPAEAGAL